MNYEEIEKQLQNTPLSVIMRERGIVRMHLRELRNPGTIVSLAEYKKLSKVLKALDDVIASRRKK